MHVRWQSENFGWVVGIAIHACIPHTLLLHSREYSITFVLFSLLRILLTLRQLTTIVTNFLTWGRLYQKAFSLNSGYVENMKQVCRLHEQAICVILTWEEQLYIVLHIPLNLQVLSSTRCKRVFQLNLSTV